MLLLLAAIVLFVAALIGLFSSGGPLPKRPPVAPDGAPPVDHIDESSRDALREILREEDAD